MTIKAKLALELLENEFELLNKAQQLQILGGVDPPLANGYCYFNALAYAGSLVGYASSDGNTYLDSYNSQYGSNSHVLSSTGQVLGQSSDKLMDIATDFFYASQLSNGMEIVNYIRSGSPVIAQRNSVGPNGESVTHAIVLTGINSDGTYQAYDPTSQQNLPGLNSADLNSAAIMGISGSKNLPLGSGGYPAGSNG